MTRRVALVTGVGRRTGIGFGIARQLAAAGWDLAITAWPRYDARYTRGPVDVELPAIRAELTELGARVAALEVDLSEPYAADGVISAATLELGPITALVLCHAEGVEGDFETTTVESFDRHFAVNARASWRLIAGYARQLPGEHGRIVALTSDDLNDNLAYGASKGALDRIVLQAAVEYADRGIRANVINPGPIDTGWMDDETREMLTAQHPAGRLGTPKDVAQVVSFLLSDAGGWVTGRLIHADGGFSL